MSDLMMTSLTQARRQAGGSVLAHPVDALRIVLRTYLTRRALVDLTARERADIGVTHQAALAEAVRLPWDTAPGPRKAGRIGQALERARTRRLLAQMQARDLSDIGIGRASAQEEANKTMWQR
jgi:uncharacterized protein YjiS (DUF1127 family)